MHASQHFQIAKVNKTVKWDPTKGPTGQKRTKIGQKSTKTGQRVPQKQAKIEQDCENDELIQAEREHHLGVAGACFQVLGAVEGW